MRAYRSSEAGLTAFLLWAETNDMTPTEELLRVGVERGWFTPEEIDVDETHHLRAIVALNREEAAGAHRRIFQLEAALHALVDKAPLDLDWNPGDCAYCHGESSQWVRDQDGIVHAPDCPIVKGRELLKEHA